MSTSSETPAEHPRATRLRDEWDSYEREVMDPEAGTVQRSETRQAFYAGATAIMFSVIRAISPGRETTADDLQVMQDLRLELEAFAANVRAGKV